MIDQVDDKDNPGERLLTTAEAAAYLGISARMIRQAALAGRLPARMAQGTGRRKWGGGAIWLFNPKDLAIYQERTRAARAQLPMTPAERSRRYRERRDLRAQAASSSEESE